MYAYMWILSLNEATNQQINCRTKNHIAIQKLSKLSPIFYYFSCKNRASHSHILILTLRLSVRVKKPLKDQKANSK